jgi:hypothetical protein
MDLRGFGFPEPFFFRLRQTDSPACHSSVDMAGRTSPP